MCKKILALVFVFSFFILNVSARNVWGMILEPYGQNYALASSVALLPNGLGFEENVGNAFITEIIDRRKMRAKCGTKATALPLITGKDDNSASVCGNSPLDVFNPGPANCSLCPAVNATIRGVMACCPGTRAEFSGCDADVCTYTCNVFVPTAASVSISGRVHTLEGRGLRNAVVALTDLNGNTRTTRTNPFGYYRFNDVEVGKTYVVAVASKRYVFEPSNRVITPDEDLTNEDFVAENLK